MLKEEKSISSNVTTLTRKIVSELMAQVRKTIAHMSSVTHIPYKEGNFPVDCDGLLNDIPTIDINWIVYYFRTPHESMAFQQTHNVNCEGDYDSHSINIVAIYVNGYGFEPDFSSTVAHEVEHLFQYSNNFQKSAQGNTLYEIIRSVIESDENGIAKDLATLLYYTFPHEQDAFAHQFYVFLRDNDVISPFREAIEYNNYKIFNELVEKIRWVNPDELKLVLRETFNMSWRQFQIRVGKARKRFYKKLRNAYELHMSRRDRLNEGYNAYSMVNRVLRLQQLYERTYSMKFALEVDNIESVYVNIP